VGFGDGSTGVDDCAGVDLAPWGIRFRRSTFKLSWLVLTSWLFYQAFVLYLRFERATQKRTRRPVRELQLAAILFYVCSGLTHVTPWLLDQRGEISDAAGQLWRKYDLRANAVLIMVFTMFFSSAIALLRLATDSSLGKIDSAIPRMGDRANDAPENKVK
jgi:hypothetical protein